MMKIMRAAGLVVFSTALGVFSASSAHAFCGFYVSGADAKLFNNATQVALMRSGTRTVLSMQNNYQGPPEQFAMVVPVPVVLQKENVKTLDRAVFDKLDQMSAPRLVEYWEQDPCYVAPPEEEKNMPQTAAAPGAPKGGSGADGFGVKIEAQFTVGEYEIVILSAKDAGGLDGWLRANKYSIPANAEPLFKPYVQRGSKFFVAKVDPQKVKFVESESSPTREKVATLSPLRFHYDDEQFTLPIRLGLINAKDAQDLVVHVLANNNQRYEVANYANATIPTNFDVSENAKTEFGAFYTALFDKTVEKHPKAVITEYSWAANTCDPCPGPTLQAGDLLTLGADALPGPDCSTPEAKRRPECQPWARTNNFVLTRLHARYTKDSLGEDLIFKAAEPIVGGRESRDAQGALEHGAAKSTINNFQARYAIRHPWTGKIECKEPRRGIWGGPPDGVKSTPPPKAPPSQTMAMAKRGTELTPFVRSNIPELGIAVDPAKLPPVVGNDIPPGPPPQKSRCGCDVPGLADGATSALPAAIAGLIAVTRRRRRVRPM